MSNTTLAAKVSLPYAEALLELVQKTNTKKEISTDVSTINELLSNSSNLTSFLSNPLITSTVKKEVIKKLFSGQISDLLLTFLMVLVERKRIEFTQLIFQRYLELANTLESIVVADVCSAVQLTEEQNNQIIAKLKQMTQTNEVKLNITTDPSLIGGFTIQIGSKIIDASLIGQLKEITSFLQV